MQRTAAWSLRQIYGAHPDTDDRELAGRARLAERRACAGAPRASSPIISPPWRGATDLVTALDWSRRPTPLPPSGMQAVRGLWQAWFWNAGVRSRAAGSRTRCSPGSPSRSIPGSKPISRAAVYNLADENIRYLYNNWVALLGKPEDRDRAIQGRLAVESQLAG